MKEKNLSINGKQRWNKKKLRIKLERNFIRIFEDKEEKFYKLWMNILYINIYIQTIYFLLRKTFKGITLI